MTATNWDTATAVLRLATELIDGVQAGLAARGFTQVRPVHGFAFARLSGSPATAAQLAEHLGITKQATSELVAHLRRSGYVTRTPDPHDRRAHLLALTARGHACTQAAQAAAAETVDRWLSTVEPRRRAELQATLAALPTPGPLRPAW